MPRNSAGEFYLTAGTAAVRDQVAHSAHVNQRFADLQFDANFPRPLLVGGTGASTAAQARINLGVPATSVVALLAGVNVFQTRQEIDTPADTKLRLRGSALSVIEVYSTVEAQRVGLISFDNTAGNLRLYLDPAGGQPSVRLDLNRDGTLKVNGSTVYHTGNKPSAADVGALPATAKAADADKLDGLDSADFARSARTISAGVGLTGGGDLAANRTITADLATRAEAEAGAATEKLMTPERVRQAIIAQTQAADTPGATAFLRCTGAVSIGLTYSGATLTAAGLTPAGALHVGSTAMSGQWKALGACPANGATLFIRIS